MPIYHVLYSHKIYNNMFIIYVHSINKVRQSCLAYFYTFFVHFTVQNKNNGLVKKLYLSTATLSCCHNISQFTSATAGGHPVNMCTLGLCNRGYPISEIDTLPLKSTAHVLSTVSSITAAQCHTLDNSFDWTEVQGVSPIAPQTKVHR